MIRGARQVGKSTLVRLFAESQGLSFHEVNLERHPELTPVFASRDTGAILTELKYLIGKGTIPGPGSLLFLDEIQAIPEAIPMLRYFYEEVPDLAVIAAGSLMEFVLADHHFSMPVGRIEYLFLEPMGFQEFLTACGEDDLLALLNNYHWADQFPAAAHERLLKRQRDYFLVGGMPEAVESFALTGEIESADASQTSILNTWRDDFSKYATSAERSRLQKVFDYVPGAVSEKIKYVRVDPHEQSRNLKPAFDLLAMAKIIRRVFHTDGAGIPLGATMKNQVFKTYFLDVGLVNSACGVQHISMDQMRDVAFINKGGLAEQFVAQHLPLLSADNRQDEMTYWLREGRANNAELDFLIQLGTDIVPIEVKAGKSGSLKSLLEFVHLRHLDRAVRLDLNPPNRQSVSHGRTHGRTHGGHGDSVEFTLLSLPLYMIEELPRLWVEAGLDR